MSTPPNVNITIPVTKRRMSVPKPISKLIFQLNYRGFLTDDIKWGEIVEVDLRSYKIFEKFVRTWRRGSTENIRKLFLFIKNELEFKVTPIDPLDDNEPTAKDGSKEMFKVVMLLPQSSIDKFRTLFYHAHIRKTK